MPLNQWSCGISATYDVIEQLIQSHYWNELTLVFYRFFDLEFFYLIAWMGYGIEFSCHWLQFEMARERGSNGWRDANLCRRCGYRSRRATLPQPPAVPPSLAILRSRASPPPWRRLAPPGARSPVAADQGARDWGEKDRRLTKGEERKEYHSVVRSPTIHRQVGPRLQDFHMNSDKWGLLNFVIMF